MSAVLTPEMRYNTTRKAETSLLFALFVFRSITKFRGGERPVVMRSRLVMATAGWTQNSMNEEAFSQQHKCILCES